MKIIRAVVIVLPQMFKSRLFRRMIDRLNFFTRGRFYGRNEGGSYCDPSRESQGPGLHGKISKMVAASYETEGNETLFGCKLDVLKALKKFLLSKW